jgi:Ca2+-binding EF-hand superfamily protein
VAAQASELYRIFREYDVKETGQLTLADMQKGLDAAGYSVEQV